MILRNTAAQPILIGPLLAVADGAEQTSGAAIAVRKDGTDVGTPAGTLTHVASAVWQYIPTAGETDCGIMGLVLSKALASAVPLNVVTTRLPVQTTGVLPAAVAGASSGLALVSSVPTAATIATAVWADAPAGTPVADIADAVWADAPAGTPVADIAAAVRDVSNAAPAAGSLGEAVNDAGGGGGGGASAADIWAYATRTLSTSPPTAAAIADAVWADAPAGTPVSDIADAVWADATGAAVGTRVALLPTSWPANLSSLAIDAAGNVNANVEEWRGGVPNVLNSGQVDAIATTTLPSAAPFGWITAASFTQAAADKVWDATGRTITGGTITTYTGNTPQTGDSFARIGATGSGLTSLAPASTALSSVVWTATIAGRIDAAISSRSTYAGGDTSGTITLLTRLSDARATNLDDLDAPVTSRMATFTYTAPDNATIAAIHAKTTNLPIDPASQSAVTAVHNSTDVVAVVPTQIQRPASGTQTYRIELYLYDDDDAMLVPDSAPTIALVTNDGTSRAARLDSTTMANVSPGRYRAIYTADEADPTEQLLWQFTVIEAAVTKVYGATTLVVDTVAVDFDTVSSAKLDDLHNRLTAGRATNLDLLDVASSLIKAKTDLIPASPAAVGSNMGTVTSVTGSVGSVVAGVTLAAGTHTGAIIPRTTLVDTVTTNTDMRGTDNAATAATAATILAKTNLIPAQPAAVGSNMGTVTSVTGAVGSVTGPVTVGTVNDKAGYSLAATGLDALSTALNGAPSTFREWLIWATLRFRRTRKNKTTGAISVYGTDSTTIITTQTSTDTTTEQTTGVTT